jgi:hypothetical protein
LYAKNTNPCGSKTAVDSLLENVKRDPAIQAVYVYGSLLRGDMWHGFNLNLYAITKDERFARKVVVHQI